MFHQEGGLGEAPKWFSRWHGDGIIARIESRRTLRALRSRSLPVVDLRCRFESSGFPAIDTDHQAIVSLAVDHLLGRGFRELAFCGFDGVEYSDKRRRCFIQRLRRDSLSPHCYQSSRTSAGGDTSAMEADAMFYEKELGSWLRSLPKPVGLMACNDIRASQVISACRDHGILVPDQVAIVGVDDDTLLCELADPPITSVKPDTEQTGYLAAATLDRIMDGGAVRQTRTEVPPKGLVARRSTDVLAVADPVLADALRFIRLNAVKGIGVAQIAARVPVSRRVLERRFREVLGRTIYSEIQRVRMERVAQLLAETDWSLDVIARQAAFAHAEYLYVAFKRHFGRTPGQFREQRGPRANDKN